MYVQYQRIEVCNVDIPDDTPEDQREEVAIAAYDTASINSIEYDYFNYE